MTAQTLRARGARAHEMVRYAEPAEFDDIAALLLRANAEYRDAMPAAIFRAYADSLRALALDPAAHGHCELLVIESGGALMGTVTFYPDAGSEGLGLPKGWAGLRALAVALGKLARLHLTSTRAQHGYRGLYDLGRP